MVKVVIALVLAAALAAGVLFAAAGATGIMEDVDLPGVVDLISGHVDEGITYDEGIRDEERGSYCDDLASSDPHPTGENLAAAYDVSYEEIMGWFCAGYGFGEIKLAYMIGSQNDVTAAEIFAQRESGAGWGEIKKAYDVSGKNKDKDKDKPEADNDEERGIYCEDIAGGDPHPAGDKLAAAYDVSYEEIMGWFCAGYGFGEIKLAYTIGGQNDVTAAEIFAQRENGTGWGEIKKAYGASGKDKDKDKGKDKDKDKADPEKGQGKTKPKKEPPGQMKEKPKKKP